MQVLILGANSDVAGAAAAEFAKRQGADLHLASRDMPRLQKLCRDLAIRYQINAEPVYFDACEFESHREFYHRLSPAPDVVILSFGYLDPSRGRPSELEELRRTIDTNLTGAVSILEIVAADFARRGRGTIIGISSAAGERGRQSNYIYGAAKAGLSVYLSGLRNRLAPDGVSVITIIPGFVDTKMTAAMSLPSLLTASPQGVAQDIFEAFRRKRAIVYSRWYWRWIMLTIKLLPEPLFKRLHL